jgi:8-oxo-dGTP pyrophosphatase MutT (NUDIX family)
MEREVSAGGVVVRRLRHGWYVAAIVPRGKPDVLALPKGLVAAGEAAAAAAAREVAEETGVRAELVGKLGDVRYVYARGGERVFKLVSFHLFRYRRGRLGDVAPAHAHEVEGGRWVPLAEAPRRLTYRGEREMAARALARLDPGAGEDAL